MKNPLVSVIMPVYNGSKTLQIALNSLLNQTYDNWICVIVNDGSTDNTQLILDNLTDNRFKIIHLSENRGRGYARQVALENSVGDYLTYLDADDFYHPDKLSRQVEVLASNDDLFLVACAQLSFDSEYNVLSVRGFKYSGVFTYMFGDTMKFIPVTSMIRLSEAKKVNYNSKLNAAEDVDYFSHYLHGRKFFIINEILFYYSEYDSISYSKIIMYNYHVVKSICYIRRELPIYVFIKRLLSALMKLFIVTLIFPFVNKNSFIKRRGQQCNASQLDEFIEVINRVM